MALYGVFTKSGTRVLHDGEGVPVIMPVENVARLGPMGPMASMFRGLPDETFMYYVYATPADKAEHLKKVNAGKMDPLFYKSQPRYGAGYDAIDEIFKRAPKSMIATYEVALSTEGGLKDLIFVNMMSVRPGWKRNGINMSMMRHLLEKNPGRSLMFSSPTPDGKAFIAAARALGLPVLDQPKK